MIALLRQRSVAEREFEHTGDHEKTVAHEELEHKKLEALRLLECFLVRNTCPEHYNKLSVIIASDSTARQHLTVLMDLPCSHHAVTENSHADEWRRTTKEDVGQEMAGCRVEHHSNRETTYQSHRRRSSRIASLQVALF